MERRPIAVRPETPLKKALELLIENNISGLPVVNADGRIEGVLSEKDLLKLFYEPQARTVDAVMTRDPVTIDVDAPLVEVFDCLMAYDFRRVLIHDDAKKLIGLVSRADLMPTILDELIGRVS
jgi:CBS domain-containing protein